MVPGAMEVPPWDLSFMTVILLFDLASYIEMAELIG
jgi:hypothetical protein